jgi:hypothetical protein
LVLLCCLIETASAAFNHAATEPHYGNFSLRESEASEFSTYEIADPTKENGEWIYDGALGVPVYVRQNPWTSFDPDGLTGWQINPMPMEVMAGRAIAEGAHAYAQTHPRVMGGVKAAGGAAETIVGGAAILAPEPTMVTKVVGTAAVAHGADTFQAGVHQMFSGEQQRTLTSQGIEKVATAAGASNPVAIGEWTDAGLGMGLSLGSGFLSNTAKAPAIISSARLTAQEAGNLGGQAKSWWLKGAEGDAAWSGLSATDKFYFEIGQKTLNDATFGNFSHITDTVARGKAMVEEMGVVKATMTVSPKAANPGAAGTLSTGPTPGARAGIRAGGVGGGVAGESTKIVESKKEDDE